MSFPTAFFRWRPHPWHGLETGPNPPQVITAFIEITPFDLVKYEVDKQTGYTRIDRPQRGAATPPTLYGLIPRTYCGTRVASLSPSVDRADGDPLDVCVVSERPISRGEILLDAWVVGGLRMLDNGEADDKIIAVLKDDPVWGDVRELAGLPPALVDRLDHYFSTYKSLPGERAQAMIEERYGSEHAFAVVDAAIADYRDAFGE